MNKKGFTLVELLVVVLIISIVAGLHRLSHNRAIANRNNEVATTMLIELANAARLHNELHPENKIAGGFNDNSVYCNGCLNPCELFESDNENANAEKFYALSPASWGIATKEACANTINYRDYTFSLCNPNFKNNGTDRQPPNCSTDNDQFAILRNPDGVVEAYIDKNYELVNNFSVSNVN